MTVRQAGAPIADTGFRWAALKGCDKLITERFDPSNKSGPLSLMDAKCRLYPRLMFFFDGTGNNLERDLPLNQLSNVAKLFRAAVDDRQKLGSSKRYISGVETQCHPRWTHCWRNTCMIRWRTSPHGPAHCTNSAACIATNPDTSPIVATFANPLMSLRHSGITL
jgi:Uncharacterized alpha/beta hydrolase domain (DUF2235)